MMPQTRSGSIGRLQFQASESSRHIEAGVRLRTHGLEGDGVIGTAYQGIGANTNSHRRITLDAAVVAGKVTGMDRTGRREDNPAQ